MAASVRTVDDINQELQKLQHQIDTLQKENADADQELKRASISDAERLVRLQLLHDDKVRLNHLLAEKTALRVELQQRMFLFPIVVSCPCPDAPFPLLFPFIRVVSHECACFFCSAERAWRLVFSLVVCAGLCLDLLRQPVANLWL